MITWGNAGRDILIGGKGKDRLLGNGGDDVLIAGYTAYDANIYSLSSIDANGLLSDHLQRGSTISGLTDWLTDAALEGNVFDDQVEDILTGSTGDDWFIGHRDRSSYRPERKDLEGEWDWRLS